MTSPIYYLACPFFHHDPGVIADRVERASQAAAELIARGLIVYSPISMTARISEILGERDPIGSDYWIEFDNAFMEFCSELVILALPGWEESRGVARERQFFAEKGRKVWFFDEFVRSLAELGRRPDTGE